MDREGLMHHGPYVAKITFWEDDDRFHGRTVNTGKDVVAFQGRSIDELREDFAAQVAVYEDVVRGQGREPAPLPFAG